MGSIVYEICQRCQVVRRWKKAGRSPGWAFGLATVGLVLLASADFVMLGDQLSQSFSGYGYVVVVACLAGIIMLPIPIAHFLHDILQEKASELHFRRDSLVKGVISLALAAALIACFASITAFRMSQADANAQIQEQTEALRGQASEITVNSNRQSTQASPETQTLLLTTLLVVSSVYSFSLTWAKASAGDVAFAESLKKAWPAIKGRADVASVGRVGELRRGELIIYAEAKKAADVYALVFDASELAIQTIKAPEDDHLAAKRIEQVIADGQKFAPLEFDSEEAGRWFEELERGVDELGIKKVSQQCAGDKERTD